MRNGSARAALPLFLLSQVVPEGSTDGVQFPSGVNNVAPPDSVFVDLVDLSTVFRKLRIPRARRFRRLQ